MTDADGLLGRVLYRFADRAWVAHVQSDYVRFFRDRGEGRVLDLGTGRGIFLEILKQSGIPATGVDSHPESVRECRERGFADVAEGDVVEFLEAKATEGVRYGGILCSQLIEHLPGDRAVRLLALCARLLSPGSSLMVVTPNVANLYVLARLYWLDPTHVRPYGRELIEALMVESGLRIRASYADPRTRPEWKVLSRLLWSYGPSAWSGLDAVIVGQRPT